MLGRLKEVTRLLPGVGRASDRLLEQELDAILRDSAIKSVYQPIVSLDTREVVGYEALARGPEGSPLQWPDALFNTARRTNRLAELDWICRLEAVRGALDAGFKRPLSLFVNIEPSVMHARMPERLRGLWNKTRDSDLMVMVEITERQLTSHPADMLRIVARLRRFGWGVALDDVGADPRSLALMPLLRPDVIKLDMGLVQGEQQGAIVTEIVGAVHAEAERTGGAVLAEGIETQAHFESALALGASLGQGYLFARPDALPATLPACNSGLPLAATVDQVALSSPFAVASSEQDPRPATYSILERIARRLEEEMPNIGESAVLLASFDDVRPFEGEIKAAYERHGRRAALVAVAGAQIEMDPGKGVRGVHLDRNDLMLDQWVVIVLGPYFAGAMAARSLDAATPQGEKFEYVLTYERDLVIEMAESFVARIAPADGVPAPAGENEGAVSS